jgi:beta-glucosidase
MPFDIRYPEGPDVGYRWFEKTGAKPTYPFGYGLSYSTFGYDKIRAEGGRQLKVTFTVTNTGKRDGADVPQVYVSPPGRTKRLIGWSKPYLNAGESRTVTITADPRSIGEFDEKQRKWIVPEGHYGVGVGHDAGTITHRVDVFLGRLERRP